MKDGCILKYRNMWASVVWSTSGHACSLTHFFDREISLNLGSRIFISRLRVLLREIHSLGSKGLSHRRSFGVFSVLSCPFR